MRRFSLLALAVFALSGCSQSGGGGSSSQASWQTRVELGMSCESLTEAEHEKCESAYEAKKNHEAAEKEANEIKEALREKRRLNGE